MGDDEKTTEIKLDPWLVIHVARRIMAGWLAGMCIDSAAVSKMMREGYGTDRQDRPWATVEWVRNDNDSGGHFVAICHDPETGAAHNTFDDFARALSWLMVAHVHHIQAVRSHEALGMAEKFLEKIEYERKGDN